MEKKSGNLDLKGRKAATTPVLSQNLAILLRPHLPALCRLPRSWTLVYSLDQHGISLNTLYTRCEEALSPSRAVYPGKSGGVGLGTRGVLLIIKDASGAGEEEEGTFGAWIADGEGLSMGKKGRKGYFSGGESFLWKFTQGTLKVYKTTGKNNYVALCEPGYISFGGGDGYYGLYLDDTLYDRSSAPCPTFDNEPLCSPGPKKAGTSTVEFECVGLEAWGLGP
ncbi:TLD-domain-containing protein [Phlegmacium glaucopus]|nr:TLD-domain-containing protein [Phlegmacium glaucopus]